jgi:hypothetical protein
LGKIKQSLGVLAAAALAVTGVSAGVASAATHPNVGTKAAWQAAISHVQQPGNGCYHASYPALQWHAVKCVAAPRLPLAPTPYRSGNHANPATVGDGHDYSAKVTGLISKAVGTFTHVSSNITEKGAPGGTGGEVANGFSLQLNSQFFTGSPACAGASNPADCQAWQQFVYTYNTASSGDIFMQYWLIDYNATCPAGWFTYSTDCYTNSAAATVKTITAKELATLKLTATAKSGGSDGTSLSIGTGAATSVTGKDTKVDLAKFWNTTEWGVFGDGGGSEAHFGTDNTLEAQTALTDSAGAKAPTCILQGYTGETSNLKLAHTAALGSQPSPTMGSLQTDGTSGTASCAVAA